MTQTPTRETKSELARRLKIHRHRLDVLLARPGAPRPDRRKRYDLGEATAFISSQTGAGSLDTLRAAKLKEIQLRCEALRRQLARDDREVLTVGEVNKLLGHVAQKLCAALYGGIEGDLPPKLDGQPAVEARRILREWGDALVELMRDSLKDHPAKIGFPEEVSTA